MTGEILKMYIPDVFETAAAGYVAAMSGYLKGREYLLFASPLSARSPDTSCLWHHAYRRRYYAAILIRYLARFAVRLISLPWGLFKKRISWGYVITGKISDRILVVFAMCCRWDNGGKLINSYVRTGEDDRCLVIGPRKSLAGEVSHINELGVIEKWEILKALCLAGTRAKLSDSALLFLEWVNWVLGLGWLELDAVWRTCDHVLGEKGIKKAGCVQEMHSSARIVWHAARKHGLRTYTVQHASISMAKTWYFTHEEERKAGVVLPDVMYIFNSRVKELLSLYYPGTLFKYGCSSRYAIWKDIRVPVRSDGYHLFVTGLARFDNEVVLGAMFRLIEKGNTGKIRLRLHPFAKMSREHKRRVNGYDKKGTVEISRGVALSDDIQGAGAVIGFSSTVLEEALMMNRPVVQLAHPYYLRYIDLEGLIGVAYKDHDKLSGEGLRALSEELVDYSKVREILGINHKEVDYGVLFS
ncbi:MAG: hypothetical protein HQL30_03295 [Candidatus Omnitrophica bacterium]|nr:hypothetical protein [Candidatus Omnitrophota bacterium]